MPAGRDKRGTGSKHREVERQGCQAPGARGAKAQPRPPVPCIAHKRAHRCANAAPGTISRILSGSVGETDRQESRAKRIGEPASLQLAKRPPSAGQALQHPHTPLAVLQGSRHPIAGGKNLRCSPECTQQPPVSVEDGGKGAGVWVSGLLRLRLRLYPTLSGVADRGTAIRQVADAISEPLPGQTQTSTCGHGM